eukprot:2131081-Rhodomonas_salina.2
MDGGRFPASEQRGRRSSACGEGEARREQERVTAVGARGGMRQGTSAAMVLLQLVSVPCHAYRAWRGGPLGLRHELGLPVSVVSCGMFIARASTQHHSELTVPAQRATHRSLRRSRMVFQVALAPAGRLGSKRVIALGSAGPPSAPCVARPAWN